MHYFTWKLELVSDILWMIVGSVSIELKYLVVMTHSQQRHVNNTRHFKVSFVQNKSIIIATETKVYHFWLLSGSNEVNLCIWFDCNFIGFSQNIGHWEPKSSCCCSVYVEQFLERSLIKPYFVHLVAKFDVGNTLFNAS